MHIPSDLKPYINSSKEKLRWYSQPVQPDASPTLKPVAFMLLALSVGFFIYATYIIFVELPLDNPNGIRNLLLSLTVGIFFLGAGMWLPKTAKLQKNDTYYVVTDQRVMTIKHNSDDPGKSDVTSWGAGDISEPSVKPDRIIFVETAQDFGKTEKDDPRVPIGWGGFLRLPPEQAPKAQKYIKELIDPKDSKEIASVDNKKFKFKFTPPAGWTIRTFIIPDSHRDDLLFTTLASNAIEKHSLLQGTKIDAAWNTVILTKRLPSTLGPESGALNHLTMLVEASAGEGEPEVKPETYDAGSKVNFAAAVKIKDFFVQSLNKAMVICELRKGLKISDTTIKNLEGKMPSKILKQVEGLKGREFGPTADDEKIFLNTLQKAIEKKEHFNTYKKLILKYSKMENPLVRQGDTDVYKLQLHKNAKNAELSGLKGYQMESGITIIGTEYKIKQIYAYKYMKPRRKCLHLRFTFFCIHKEITQKNDEGKEEKTTLFDQNKGGLDKLARSTILARITDIF